MTFDFDRITDRRNTNSLKWDECPGTLPLWVADMDFETAPCVKEAICRRAAHGVFGYSIIPDAWYDSYIYWWKTRHNFELNKEWLVFCTGVVPAISTCVRKLTTPAEKVLIQTPVYNIFFNSIVNNGRYVVESPLDFDGSSYSMNFQRLEKDLSDPQVTLMILCNPHNPCGRIWTKDELSRVGELCQKYGVTVISDEIHCDITLPDCSYVPFASVSETCAQISVSCVSPTKCFNIAGLNSAAVVAANPLLRHKVWRGLNTDECAEPNAFAMDATVAAFTQGGQWLDELRVYLADNRKYACSFIEKNIQCLKPVPAKATYLLWVQVSQSGMKGSEFAEKLKADTGLYVCEGAEYGKAGEDFIRINLACPRSILEDAMCRLEAFCRS